MHTRTESARQGIQGSDHVLIVIFRRMMLVTLNLIIVISLQMVNSKKVVVKYFDEDFLVESGCKARDETVLK